MAKKKTTKPEMVSGETGVSTKPITSTNEKNASTETRSIVYCAKGEPVVNTQVEIPKKRVRNRHKPVKKLSAAIICATTSFRRFG